MKFLKTLATALGLSMSLDQLELANRQSIDDVILEHENKTGKNFIGGEFLIEHVSDRVFRCSYRLFFQDAKGGIEEVASTSGDYNAKHLSEEARAELKAEKIIKYEIDEPFRN